MAATEGYEEFLASKRVSVERTGFDVDASDIHPMLFPFQRDVVRWALRLGKAALFEERGLGKTIQQVEWARHVAAYTSGKVLIVAPLAVSRQTVREAAKIGVAAAYVRSQEQADAALERIVITNYEMLEKFDASHFAGVVIDESGILKGFTSTTKRLLISMFRDTHYKLACTATPAPNDHLELGNHAEFLDVMPSNEMISRWFINNTMKAGNYRLKAHAEKDFWRWVASWAVCISVPSDLGYSDEGFILPPLRLTTEVVEVDHTRAYESGEMFLLGAPSATAMWRDKAATAEARCERAHDIIGDSADTWLVWCDTDKEQDILEGLFGERAFSIRGSDPATRKLDDLDRWLLAQRPILITKADIFGWGANFQHCHKQVFVGLTYSFEKFYQAVGRTHRFGQKHLVDAYLVYAESEGDILATLERKKEAHREMQKAMNDAMGEVGLNTDARRLLLMDVERRTLSGKGWTLYQDDAVRGVGELADDSVDYWVFSPPFSNLYIYSDSIADMGNSADHSEFFAHFGHLIKELYRATVPGRLCSVHCKDLPLYMNRDGAAGLYDFPGELVRAFESHGWVFHSRVTIWKDPVIEMHRTQNHGLLYKNFRERGEVSRQGMADYVLTFRKWLPERDTTREKPVLHERSEWPLEIWQRYASPVWSDIQQTNVLNYELGRDGKDEKHICPLQLDVIERCIQLWSNPGDLVGSPFAGIGSEGFQALMLKRRFVGWELKASYVDVAARNLADAERRANLPTLWSLLGESDNAGLEIV